MHRTVAVSRRSDLSVSQKLRMAAGAAAACSALLMGASALAQTPAVGAKAPNFTLGTITGTPVELAKQEHGSPLVLVVLRGYPGYDCPFCVKQVHDFVEHAADFAAKKTAVLLVYPGPSANLDQHAREFLAKQADLPANITLVLDPEYKVTNQYGLRWDEPHQTAYPSTFILDKSGTVTYEKISHTVKDRLGAQEALDHLPGN